MNDNPRLCFFDIDAEKFSAMLDEMTREKVVIPMDEIWNEDYYESMDGDWDSAMASAGFGTDEDYGIFDDYNDFYGEE